MKIEPRGKYPGVKVHLDKAECEEVLAMTINPHDPLPYAARLHFLTRIGKALRRAMVDRPTLLDERTEEEIIKELEVEKAKSELKLAAIAKGKDWKKVKVEE